MPFTIDVQDNMQTGYIAVSFVNHHGTRQTIPGASYESALACLGRMIDEGAIEPRGSVARPTVQPPPLSHLDDDQRARLKALVESIASQFADFLDGA